MADGITWFTDLYFHLQVTIFCVITGEVSVSSLSSSILTLEAPPLHPPGALKGKFVSF